MKAYLVLPSLALTALALTGCVATSESDAGTSVAVSSTDDACTLTAPTAPAGAVTFRVANDGTDVTEFYLYAEDGTTVVGELEDVGPGIARSFTVTLDAGTYVAACKPGMTGDGIRSPFTAN